MNQTIPTQATLAFTLANGLAIQLITLSVALIGLTVTFAKDFQHNSRVSTWLLIGIWIALFISIYSGLNTIKALISIIERVTIA
jgi:FtsH-binding integral membrane protein